MQIHTPSNNNNNNNNNNNSNKIKTPIAVLPLTTHPQLWVELLIF